MEKTPLQHIEDLISVKEQNGNWNYNPYMHGMLNGLILAKYLMDNKEPIFKDAPEKWLDVDAENERHSHSVELLTKLQAELGYVKGEISTVAMLGLVGEAGEVLAETEVSIFNARMNSVVGDVIRSCVEADKYKKDIRKDSSRGTITLDQNNSPAFDSELADTLYYLNILATNRGLTIFDLARMGHDKVRAKQAQGGSSEDPKIKA